MNEDERFSEHVLGPGFKIQQSDPKIKFLEKMPFATPFVGGTTAGPKNEKKYKEI